MVGQVTEEERDYIKILFERKNGLIELSKIIDHTNEFLYEKLVKDMGETSIKFQKWWDKMAAKYNWESIKGYSWEIDFDTCDIYLKKDD